MSNREASASHVEALRSLTAPGELLVLPNAWDALSARLVEDAGARAIATSSAAVAWARGYRDGEGLPFAELAEVARAIARVTSRPVTVDAERGYAESPEEVADNVARLVAGGAAGVNLEDGGADPALLVAKIRAVKARLGSGIFLNARTCVVLHRQVEGDAIAPEVVRRARLFEAAGADGLFVPGLATERDLEAVVASTRLPLNVLLGPGLPPLAALRRLGVRRLTVGTGLADVAYGAARKAARALLEGDDVTDFAGADLPYRDIQALFPPSG
ncbi:MAG: putative carboxyvinyl-carboxyphosphonate phosphorylmutase [Labilithrix sp.]|nr:putative carboxyvinyl-carboxyphosphonate phosphorylmutase [Labilithrix sp.]